MEMFTNRMAAARRTKILFMALVMLLACAVSSAAAGSVEEAFKKSFPQIPAEQISETPVKGIYEVLVGNQILYYAPESDCLIIGAMVTKDGKNLTEEKIEKVIAAKAKDLPLDSAIKIGRGPHRVIEITDLDCPYCRKASAFFSGRSDVTRYVFLYPLSYHKDAEAKVMYVLCAVDQGKAYEEAMKGKLDDMKFKPCKDARAEETLKNHREIVSRLGLSGTPFFLIGDEAVFGADIPRIESLLKSK
ncbi:thiol:disulfide interchange protein [Syntrophus aciditrophicus SB]|uniref:Thiol:disulfide interchange protein n=2 Tax=Syntrophus TaxID=43773 RepID=Q2LWX1_SYNAS|nr:thiol:disulfide interchange protein [Syntrophus aciditrophicus SB]